MVALENPTDEPMMTEALATGTEALATGPSVSHKADTTFERSTAPAEKLLKLSTTGSWEEAVTAAWVSGCLFVLLRPTHSQSVLHGHQG
eukprot:3803347-Karenia_brevis.AAC.1